MKTSSQITQCDHCEIVLHLCENDKDIVKQRDFFDVKISFGEKAMEGIYCTTECLLNDILLKCLPTSSPIFKDKKEALESLLKRLKEKEDAIYQKHGIKIDTAIKEKLSAEAKIQEAENIKIPDTHNHINID